MAKKKFGEWKEELCALMRAEGGDCCEFDEDLAANYWREGYSPKEFYYEIVIQVADADERSAYGEDFDPRYEL